MSDDWRATIELEHEGHVDDFVNGVRALRLEDHAVEKLGDRVIVSHDGARIFLYGDSEAVVSHALEVVAPLIAERELTATTSVERWHPVAERWEDAAVPLPQTPEEIAAEHEQLVASEAEESREQGWAEWEVRVELPSHHATVAFAKQLSAEGIPVVRRWRFLLIGAASEDEARSLAERVGAEAPEGARVLAEGSGALVWRTTGRDQLAVLGGLSS